MAGRIGLVAMAILIAGCASGPDYRSDYDRSIDFASYETWGFYEPLGTDRAGYSSLISRYFREAIQREMLALGYRYVDAGTPDLLVNVAANAEDVTEVRSRTVPDVGLSYGYGIGYYGYRRGLYAVYPRYSTEVETVHYKQGTANVDVVDNRRNQLIWEGVAEGRLSRESMADPQGAISRVVAGIFDRFPTALPPAD